MDIVFSHHYQLDILCSPNCRPPIIMSSSSCYINRRGVTESTSLESTVPSKMEEKLSSLASSSYFIIQLCLAIVTLPKNGAWQQVAATVRAPGMYICMYNYFTYYEQNMIENMFKVKHNSCCCAYFMANNDYIYRRSSTI